MTIIMLHPSTVDAAKDDPTVRRCKGFAIREKCSLLRIVNLFSARAANPRALFLIDDPVGPDCDSALEYCFDPDASDRIVAAWGVLPRSSPAWFQTMHADRVQYVLSVAQRHNIPIYCFGLTDKGAPRHPLYAAKTEPLQRFIF